MYGTIHLFAQKNLNDVHYISMTLQGYEQIHVHTKKGELEKRSAIIEHKFTVYDYTDFYNVI